MTARPDMAAAIEQALAELRAIPTRPQPPADETPACPHSCTGDDRGYQWHQRTGHLPACQAALEAHRTFNREYLREWRKRRPSYHRDWRAQRLTGRGPSPAA